MADLKRVKPGEKLRIPAAAYNAFVDAATDFQRRRRELAGGGATVAMPTGQVYVKNASGSDADRFGVLAISGVLFEPTDDAGVEAFKNQVALVGETPSAADDRFVILAEPIASGELGRAWVFGVCPVQIDVSNEADAFATPDDGATNLVSSESGGVPILWKSPGTGVVWALVRLDLAGGGSALSWGKATADWESGNSVSMHPCDPDGENEDTETTITGYLICPTSAAPSAAAVDEDDVLAYLAFGEDEGIIINADLGGMPPGETLNQMLYWDGSQWALLTPPDADIKCLQRKTVSGSPVLYWDYPRYS